MSEMKGLVLEGGGFRGMYTCGVIDVNLKIKFIKMKKLEVQKGAKPLSPNIKDYCVAIILAFC